jgi:hypothetical protein
MYIKKLEMLPVDAGVLHEASVVPGPGSTRLLMSTWWIRLAKNGRGHANGIILCVVPPYALCDNSHHLQCGSKKVTMSSYLAPSGT